ncbi:MAG: hypothetical protein AAGI23_08165 [Bacteroidota bacterium]
MTLIEMALESYGIDKDKAHPRAIELIPEDFFWSCINELAPFGSDEGDIALIDYRAWRSKYKVLSLLACLKWVIEDLAEINLTDYNENLLDEKLLESQIADKNFNDHYHIYVVDVSVMATGFGQLVDEGKIDEEGKPIIQLAIDRQQLWAKLSKNWVARNEYIGNLNVLDRALKQA